LPYLKKLQAGIAAFAMAMPEAPPEETEEVAPELAIPELHSVVEGSVTWLGAEAGGNPMACEVCFTFLAGKNIGHIMIMCETFLGTATG